MKAKKENKYAAIIKMEDWEEYFNQFTAGVFTTEEEQKHIDSLTFKEAWEHLKNNNKYIICNQDEPYAELVWQIILMGEDAKRTNLDEKKLKDTFSKFEMEFYRLTKEERTNTKMMELIHKYFPFTLEE